LSRLTSLITLAALTLACGARSTPESPRPDPDLQRQLEALAGEVRGVVGIYVRNLRTGRTAAIRADEAFPTASMVKVPILIGTFDAVEKGRLGFAQPLIYTDSLLYEGTISSARWRTRRRFRWPSSRSS
jgi:beta-lactamase class A